MFGLSDEEAGMSSGWGPPGCPGCPWGAPGCPSPGVQLSCIQLTMGGDLIPPPPQDDAPALTNRSSRRSPNSWLSADLCLPSWPGCGDGEGAPWIPLDIWKRVPLGDMEVQRRKGAYTIDRIEITTNSMDVLGICMDALGLYTRE